MWRSLKIVIFVDSLNRHFISIQGILFGLRYFRVTWDPNRPSGGMSPASAWGQALAPTSLWTLCGKCWRVTKGGGCPATAGPPTPTPSLGHTWDRHGHTVSTHTTGSTTLTTRLACSTRSRSPLPYTCALNSISVANCSTIALGSLHQYIFGN